MSSVRIGIEMEEVALPVHLFMERSGVPAP
jgi:hypothetical protein